MRRQGSLLGLQTMVLFIPNRTFLVRFGGISGEFGRAMVRILARPNEPDMPPRRTKKVQLGIYRTQIFSPKFSVTLIKSARRCTECPARRIRVNRRQFSFGAFF